MISSTKILTGESMLITLAGNCSLFSSRLEEPHMSHVPLLRGGLKRCTCLLSAHRERLLPTRMICVKDILPRLALSDSISRVELHNGSLLRDGQRMPNFFLHAVKVTRAFRLD